MDRPTNSLATTSRSLAGDAKLLLTFCPGVLLLAVLLAFKLPAVYRASGTIMLEASSVPEELVRSTVVPAYADQQIELLRRRVLTVDRLSELVSETDPYPQLLELSARDKARLIAENTEIERVDPVTLEPLLESTAFSIHYHNPSPEIAGNNRVGDRRSVPHAQHGAPHAIRDGNVRVSNRAGKQARGRHRCRGTGARGLQAEARGSAAG